MSTTIEKIEQGAITLAEFAEDQQSFIRGIVKLSYNEGVEQGKNYVDLASVSVSDSSNFELQRLFDWLQESKREPAQTKFTSGMTRNVAREIEYLLKHSR